MNYLVLQVKQFNHLSENKENDWKLKQIKCRKVDPHLELGYQHKDKIFLIGNDKTLKHYPKCEEDLYDFDLKVKTPGNNPIIEYSRYAMETVPLVVMGSTWCWGEGQLGVHKGTGSAGQDGEGAALKMMMGHSGRKEGNTLYGDTREEDWMDRRPEGQAQGVRGQGTQTTRRNGKNHIELEERTYAVEQPDSENTETVLRQVISIIEEEVGIQYEDQ